MRMCILIIVLVFLYFRSNAQVFTPRVQITETYSQNGLFYIKCVPYFNQLPTPRGRSYVYNKNNELLYTLDRGFDGLEEDGNFLSLSNDGRTILYAISTGADENIDSLKSIVIYKDAKLSKSFTSSEVTHCDLKLERCRLVYINYSAMIGSQAKANNETYQVKIFKADISEQEKFLSDNAIFSNSDTAYITDSKKIVHLIDLNSASIIQNVAFTDIYLKLRSIQRPNIFEAKEFEKPQPPFNNSNFPDLANKRSTAVELAKVMNMKYVELGSQGYYDYKTYQIDIQAYILQNGKLEIINIKADKYLPIDKITTFFRSNVFNAKFLPKEIDKWYLYEFFAAFRNRSNKKAASEKQQEIMLEQRQSEIDLTADTINGVYIPKNLEDCFVQLDKMLPAATKTEMHSLKNKDEMIPNYYPMGLGLWMRNNWGLYKSSRMFKYFHDHGTDNGEEMSGIILDDYYDWLHGNKDIAKEFESTHPIKNK